MEMIKSAVSAFIASIMKIFGVDVVFDPSKDYPLPCYTLVTECGLGVMPLGNVVAVNGKPKGGKSFLIQMFVVSWLGCKIFGFSSNLAATAKIVLIDSDQPMNQMARMFYRAQKLLAWKKEELQERFILLNVREKSAEERMQVLEMAVKEIGAKIIIFDNLGHLQPDWNDPVKSYQTMNHLKFFSFEVQRADCGVLHQNKGEGDSNMHGHLGTKLAEDVSDGFSVKREGNTHSVEHRISRDQQMPKFSFVINEDGLPEICETPEMRARRQKMEAAREQREKWFYEVLGGGLPLTHTDLKQQYMTLAKRGETAAKKDIQLSLADSFLAKTETGHYMLSSLINKPF